MKKEGYRHWLEAQKYQANTISAQMFRAARVEECHGDLDEHYAQEQRMRRIERLRDSKDDERHNRPNPSKIPFEGVIRSNLASYRDAIKRYKRFLDLGGGAIDTSVSSEAEDNSQKMAEEGALRRIGLERDRQAAR